MTRAECCKSYGSISNCKLNCEFPGRVHIVGKYRKYRNTEHKTFAWKVLKSKWPTYNLSHFSNARWLDLKSQRILAFTRMANENPVYSAKCHSALPKTISKNFSASVTPKANTILILKFKWKSNQLEDREGNWTYSARIYSNLEWNDMKISLGWNHLF